jgi:hypothetical protein
MQLTVQSLDRHSVEVAELPLDYLTARFHIYPLTRDSNSVLASTV